MKKTKLFTLLLVAAPILTACGEKFQYPDFGNLKDGEKYKIGILLPVEHDALNKAADGLKEAGWEDGKNVEFDARNAQGSADQQRVLAKTLIDNCILTLGLGTGASLDLVTVQEEKGSKNPILFTAVTDPVDAELVESLEQPGGYVTGTSDAQPIDAQIGLIKTCMPDADKVGIFYTAKEPNSVVQAKQAKAAIEAAGMTAVTKTCNDSTDIETSLASLVASDGLDAIYVPTDNNVAANMNFVSDAVKGKGILVVSGEEGMLEKGGQITLSVDYTNLGKVTGQMAAQILKGEKKPSELPVVSMGKEECKKVLNSKWLNDAGIVLPDDVLNQFEDIAK